MTVVTPTAGSPVYCSGPMFSTADLTQQLAIAASLEGAGFTTYLPQRDGIEVAKVMGTITTGLDLPPNEVTEIMTFVRKIVFALDIYQLIDRCDSLVFNMDGRVPDDGSVVETAAAFTAGKPIVIYKTTPITMLGGYDNPMVEGLSTTWAYIDDVTQLPAAVTAAVTATANLQGSAFEPGPHLQAVLALGSAVWGLIPQIHAASTDNPQQLYAAVQALEAALGPLVAEADGTGGVIDIREPSPAPSTAKPKS